MEPLRSIVDARPAEHDPVVDLIRAAALVVVVLGHWVMQGLYVDARGDLHRDGLLGLADWTHPLTWLAQVMPVVFAVGGYANARSWRRARAQGQDYGAWLHVRVLRLTGPVVPLMVFWAVAAPLAPHLGLDNGWLGVASRASLVPTWFLAVYLVVTAVAPALVRAWDRWGGWTLVAGLLAAAMVDLVSLTTSFTWLAVLNVVLVWLTVHLLGVAWQDGWLVTRAPWVAVLGGVALVAVVVAGPYGVSMVGVSGHGVDNANPTRVTLLLLGLLQVGAAVAARPLVAGVASRRAGRLVSVALGGRLMTVYLWHLTSLGLATAVALWLGGIGLHARPATAAWWWQRPVWFAVLLVVLAVVVHLFGSFEHVPRSTVARRSPIPALCVALWTTAGLALLADGWLLKGDEVRWYLPVAVLAGPLLLGAWPSGRTGRRTRSRRLRTFGPADRGRCEDTIRA